VGPTKTLFPPAVVRYYDNFKDLSPELPAHLKFINFCGKMVGGRWKYKAFYDDKRKIKTYKEFKIL